MKIKRLLSFLLSVVLLLSLVACAPSGGETETTEATVPTEESVATDPAPVVDSPATFFSLSYSATPEEFHYLTAYTNEDGTAYVEYSGDGRKVATMEVAALDIITAELAASGLLALNGKQEWNEGTADGSLYVSYADDTMVTADFGGTVPEEFVSGYQYMVNTFKTLMADIPEYVPQVQVAGEVDLELEALKEIVNNSGMKGLDGLMISGIAMDEYFGMTAGLSSTDGVLSGSICSSMMMTTAYSLTVVTVEGDSEAVCADFEATMNWRKWVCVAPTNALIATKGDMVLCLMGSGQMYTLTAAAVEAAGWTEYKALENPDM